MVAAKKKEVDKKIEPRVVPIRCICGGVLGANHTDKSITVCFLCGGKNCIVWNRSNGIVTDGGRDPKLLNGGRDPKLLNVIKIRSFNREGFPTKHIGEVNMLKKLGLKIGQELKLAHSLTKGDPGKFVILSVDKVRRLKKGDEIFFLDCARTYGKAKVLDIELSGKASCKVKVKTGWRRLKFEGLSIYRGGRFISGPIIVARKGR